MYGMYVRACVRACVPEKGKCDRSNGVNGGKKTSCSMQSMWRDNSYPRLEDYTSFFSSRRSVSFLARCLVCSIKGKEKTRKLRLKLHLQAKEKVQILYFFCFCIHFFPDWNFSDWPEMLTNGSPANSIFRLWSRNEWLFSSHARRRGRRKRGLERFTKSQSEV